MQVKIHETQKGETIGTAVRINGIVSSGLGRAHVFMAQKHYQEQFISLFGEEVWPGTLNLTVTDENLVKYIALRIKSGIDTLDADENNLTKAVNLSLDKIVSHRIRGFLRDGVSFGGATAFMAKLTYQKESVGCAVLIPDLTRHSDVVEIISPIFLREFYDLKDDLEIEINLE
jgi:CTP-dependent riboflavin kinase